MLAKQQQYLKTFKKKQILEAPTARKHQRPLRSESVERSSYGASPEEVTPSPFSRQEGTQGTSPMQLTTQMKPIGLYDHIKNMDAAMFKKQFHNTDK